MGSDAHIKIVGEIKSQEDFEALIEAIDRDQPSADWGSAYLDANGAREYVEFLLGEGTDLEFSENDRDRGSFEVIELACTEIGLSFVRSTDPEDEDPGQTVVYNAKTESLRTFLGSQFGDGALVKPQEVIDLLEAGELEKALEFLRAAANPGSDLPDAFSVAEGVVVKAGAVAP